MKEKLIDFETAVLAQKKGFDWGCNYYWPDDVKVKEPLYNSDKCNWNYETNQYAAPTQSLLQKWLREKYHLHITINMGIPLNCNIMFYSNIIKFGKEHKSKFRSIFYHTYEEALETGLQEALKLIK